MFLSLMPRTSIVSMREGKKIVPSFWWMKWISLFSLRNKKYFLSSRKENIIPHILWRWRTLFHSFKEREPVSSLKKMKTIIFYFSSISRIFFLQRKEKMQPPSNIREIMLFFYEKCLDFLLKTASFSRK